MRNFLQLITIAFSLLLPFYCAGQLGAIYYNGAFSTGLQGFSNHQGSEAIFTNPAGIVNSTSTYGLLFNYTDQYGLGEISKVALGGRIKSKSGHFAIGLYQYGIAEYKEQSLNVSYARSLFENLQIGIQFNHNRLAINTFNSVAQNAVNIGMQSKINKTLMVSAMIANVLKTESGSYRSPSHVQFGLTYRPSSSISVLVEAIKQSERPLVGILSLNYLPTEKINLRLGADITRGEIGLGAFYSIAKAKMGFGYSTHQNLGGSYALSGVID
jgi:hypothetical protein